MRDVATTYGAETTFTIGIREGAIYKVIAHVPDRHLDTIENLLAEFERHRRWGEVEVTSSGKLKVTIDLRLIG